MFHFLLIIEFFALWQNQYKADYTDFMKGIGWLPLGSLEAEKNKKAMEIISEKKYRQHPDTLKYSTLMDSMNMVLAQNNAKIMNEVSLSII
jgi:nebulin